MEAKLVALFLLTFTNNGFAMEIPRFTKENPKLAMENSGFGMEDSGLDSDYEEYPEYDPNNGIEDPLYGAPNMGFIPWPQRPKPSVEMKNPRLRMGFPEIDFYDEFIEFTKSGLEDSALDEDYDWLYPYDRLGDQGFVPKPRLRSWVQKRWPEIKLTKPGSSTKIQEDKLKIPESKLDFSFARNKPRIEMKGQGFRFGTPEIDLSDPEIVKKHPDLSWPPTDYTDYTEATKCQLCVDAVNSVYQEFKNDWFDNEMFQNEALDYFVHGCELAFKNNEIEGNLCKAKAEESLTFLSNIPIPKEFPALLTCSQLKFCSEPLDIDEVTEKKTDCGKENGVTEYPRTDNPGTDNLATVNPGTDHLGTTNLVTDNPGTKLPGTVNPGTVNPRTVNPGTVNPGTDNQGHVIENTRTSTENPDLGARHPWDKYCKYCMRFTSGLTNTIMDIDNDWSDELYKLYIKSICRWNEQSCQVGMELFEMSAKNHPGWYEIDNRYKICSKHGFCKASNMSVSETDHELDNVMDQLDM